MNTAQLRRAWPSLNQQEFTNAITNAYTGAKVNINPDHKAALANITVNLRKAYNGKPERTPKYDLSDAEKGRHI